MGVAVAEAVFAVDVTGAAAEAKAARAKAANSEEERMGFFMLGLRMGVRSDAIEMGWMGGSRFMPNH